MSSELSSELSYVSNRVSSRESNSELSSELFWCRQGRKHNLPRGRWKPSEVTIWRCWNASSMCRATKASPAPGKVSPSAVLLCLQYVSASLVANWLIVAALAGDNTLDKSAARGLAASLIGLAQNSKLSNVLASSLSCLQ